MNWATVITSAAVGAVVSAGITLIGQFFERRSRRKELMLSTAVNLVFRKIDLQIKAAETTKSKLVIPEPLKLSAEYYQLLDQLLDKGKLPEEHLAKLAKNEEELKKQFFGPSQT